MNKYVTLSCFLDEGKLSGQSWFLEILNPSEFLFGRGMWYPNHGYLLPLHKPSKSGSLRFQLVQTSTNWINPEPLYLDWYSRWLISSGILLKPVCWRHTASFTEPDCLNAPSSGSSGHWLTSKHYLLIYWHTRILHYMLMYPSFWVMFSLSDQRVLSLSLGEGFLL